LWSALGGLDFFREHAALSFYDHSTGYHLVGVPTGFFVSGPGSPLVLLIGLIQETMVMPFSLALCSFLFGGDYFISDFFVIHLFFQGLTSPTDLDFHLSIGLQGS